MPPPRKEDLAEALRLIFRESVGNLELRSTMIEQEFGERIAPSLLGEGSFISVRWYLHQKVYLGVDVVFPNSVAEHSRADGREAASAGITPTQESKLRKLLNW